MKLVNKTVNEKELNKLLKELKATFRGGESLKLVYLPNHERTSNGRKLKGEVLNEHILLYEPNLEKAKFLLIHEYYEYLQSIRDKNFIKIINAQNQIIEQLLYSQRELMVNSFTKSLVQNGFTSKKPK